MGTAFNLLSGIASLAIQMLVGFFLSSYLVATLGEVANGFTQLANNFVAYASLITVAFNSMGARFISIAYNKRQFSLASRYYATLVVCNTGICIILCPAAVYIVGNLSEIVAIGDASLVDVQLLFAFVFANFAANLFVSLFYSSTFATNKLYIQNIVNLIRNILNALALLFVYSFYTSNIFYVSAVSLALTVLNIPVSILLKRFLVPEIKFNVKYFSCSSVRDLLSSGFWNTINQCGNVLMTGLDLLFANLLVGPWAMGALSVAKTIPNALIMLAGTVNSNLEPNLVISFAKSGLNGLRERVARDALASNLLVSVPVAVFCTLSYNFYKLWMPTLDPVLLSLLSLLTILAYIPWSGAQVVYNVFTAMNRLTVNSVSFILFSMANVIVVIASVRFTDLGIIAIAGTSSVLSIIRNMVIVGPYSARLLHLPWWHFYRTAAISIASFAIVSIITFFCQTLFPPTEWVSLLIVGITSCLLGWIVVGRVTFGKEEFARFGSWLRGKILQSTLFRA